MKPRECRASVTALRAVTPEIIEVDLAVSEPADRAQRAHQPAASPAW